MTDAEIDAMLYALWGQIHIDRFDVQHGKRSAPDLFYAGSVHSANIVMNKLLEFRSERSNDE